MTLPVNPTPSEIYVLRYLHNYWSYQEKIWGGKSPHCLLQGKKFFLVSRALKALVRARETLAKKKRAILAKKKSLFFGFIRLRWQYFFRQNFLVAENTLKKAQKKFWAVEISGKNLRAL